MKLSQEMKPWLENQKVLDQKQAKSSCYVPVHYVKKCDVQLSVSNWMINKFFIIWDTHGA